MFAPRLLLLALAGVASLAAHSRAQDRCTMATYGVINDNPHSLPRELLAPGNADWDVNIQIACPDEVGLLITVCDSDVSPEVQVLSLSEARVHRTGALRDAASVDTVVYCAASETQSKLLTVRSSARN